MEREEKSALRWWCTLILFFNFHSVRCRGLSPLSCPRCRGAWTLMLTRCVLFFILGSLHPCDSSKMREEFWGGGFFGPPGVFTCSCGAAARSEVSENFESSRVYYRYGGLGNFIRFEVEWRKWGEMVELNFGELIILRREKFYFVGF